MKITKRLPKMKIVVLVNLFALASVTQMQFMTPASASTQMPLDQVTQITTGGRTAEGWTCALSAGAPYCWGSNIYGQLGNGSFDNSLIPTAVDTTGVLAGKTITLIAAGDQSACVIADNSAYCWGSNVYGQLGDGTTTNSPVPVAVDTSGILAGKAVTEISIGDSFACALADNNAYCWGSNFVGQLGNGNSSDALYPVAVDTNGVLSGKTIEQLSSGPHNTCVLSEEKTYCWGYNINGQLGNGSFDNTLTPVAVDTSGILAGKAVTSVHVAPYGVCIIAAGQVYCWGDGEQWQLGDGSITDSPVPVAVDTTDVLKDKVVTEVSTGGYSRCALASGQAYCWGYGPYGEIGDGGSLYSPTPTAIDTSGVLAGKFITALAKGSSHHYCAIAAGQAYCWGLGLHGQLGGGLATTDYSPSAVSNELKHSEIHSTSFSTLDTFNTLVIQGSGFGSSIESTNQSHVSLNGVALPFCSYGFGSTAQELEDNGITPGLVSDNPPCYLVTVDGLSYDFHSRHVRIILPSDFDAAAEGTVSVNSSPVYTFNTSSGGNPGPVQPNVSVNNAKPLNQHPTIPTRPTFRGFAEPHSSVTVTVYSDPVSCTTTADSNGNWSCTLPSTLVAGEHTVYVQVTAPDSTVTNLGPYAVTVNGQTSGVITPDSPQIPGVPNTSLIDLMKAKNERAHAAATQSIVTWSITGAVSIAGAALLFMRYRRHFKPSH